MGVEFGEVDWGTFVEVWAGGDGVEVHGFGLRGIGGDLREGSSAFCMFLGGLLVVLWMVLELVCGRWLCRWEVLASCGGEEFGGLGGWDLEVFDALGSLFR